MNKDNAHLYLPFVQALVDGKTIQFFHKSFVTPWNDISEIDFSYPPDRYRIEDDVPVKPWVPKFKVGDRVRQVGSNAVWEVRKIECEGYELYRLLHDGSATCWRTNEQLEPAPWSLSRHIPGFRPLREGEEWNGNGWTEERLPYGYRPILSGEVYQMGVDEIEFGVAFKPLNHGGRETDLGSEDDLIRTRRPLPEPPKLVALGPKDVPPGSAVRPKHEGSSYHLVTGVTDAGVSYPLSEGLGFKSFQELMDKGGVILRPGQTEWQPCHKPA